MSIKKIIANLLRDKNEDFEEHEDVKIESEKPLGESITFTLLSIALIIAFIVTLKSILIPIIFAIILSVLIYPLASRMEKIGFNRAAASITAVLIGFLVFIGIGFVFVNQTINIGQDASEIVTKIQSVLERGEAWLNNQFDLSRSEIVNKAKEQLGNVAPDLGSYLTGFVGSLGSIMTFGILIPLMMFFFLYYRDFFRSFFVRAFNSASKENVEKTLSNMYEALKNYLGGMIMVMGIIAVLNSVGLWIMGIEYAWFFGILASLLMLLPYIGIAIGSIMPALFALATKDNAWYAVGVIVWFQVVQILEGNVITPNIVGSKISLNPLVSILSIFFFNMLFGFAGLILALPLMAVLKVIFDAVPTLRPYGFLFSEPKKKYLWTDRQRKRQPEKVKKEDTKEAIESKDDILDVDRV